ELQAEENEIPAGMVSIDSPATGSVWQARVAEGDAIEPGQCLMVLESMKMEIEVTTHTAGIVRSIKKLPGSLVTAGTALVIIEPNLQ
ncbi:MAG: acetyl-CoA carboxylase biotin carboxyl carrier protein subunit, partial [Pseudomonadales bacterium]